MWYCIFYAYSSQIFCLILLINFFALGRRFVKKNINIKKSSKVQPRQPIENPETNLTEEDPSALPSITLQIKTEPEEKSMLHSLQIYFVHFLFLIALDL